MRLASYMDSQQSKKAAALIVKRGRALGLLLYVVGLAYLCILPLEDMSRKSFFDENALMAGLVKREFSNRDSIARYSRGLRNTGRERTAIEEWLMEELTELGLEVYSQNFTSVRPVSFTPEESEVVGRNVYAVLRAGRAHSTEAIVLSAPLPQEGDNSNGLAVMMALAEYFKTKNYWAKDLVFLVTSHGEVGAQAWIDGYLGLRSTGILSSPLPGRSGAIQAAISLELPPGELKYVDIITEGVNGLLPNLDLVNVVQHLCQMEGVQTAFHVPWDQHALWYGQALRTVLAIGAHQSPGVPLGSHALFLRHRIDSLTLRGVAGGGASAAAAGGGLRSLTKVARALEGVFRSVNNLLETLHHSEFFYFTASSHTFISLGRYMPPFALLLAPVVMETLSLWLQARNPQLAQEKTSTSAASPFHTSRQPFPFQAVVKLVALAFLSGVALYYIPGLLATLFPPLTAGTLVGGVLSGCGTSILLPVIFRPGVDAAGWRMAKSFGLILLLLTLFAVALTNFSLGVCVALSLPLPSVLAQPRSTHESALRHAARSVAVLLTTPPLCALYLCSLYAHQFQPSLGGGGGGGGGVMEAVTRGYSLETAGLALAYSSWHLVGSWLFVFVCVVHWSFWSVSWTLCCSQHLERPHPHSD